ncbi:GroES chaperonin family member protein [Theileria equi strain WA]|uniref:GroES chaperonin family member protein n=1 Tax=Theileria equi strain WA TaxID=1537102 RepID=L0AUE1_THEEQ|nr:GroES chaperonin family member protein [Theileria equi strain WA]AFZ79175.1 GroES chaperonin family member protein [Theileria equi strain WA]|eukprot:XP_004828841.1 GroES chaperonin family member protein [Theileria equi strain WA]
MLYYPLIIPLITPVFGFIPKSSNFNISTINKISSSSKEPSLRPSTHNRAKDNAYSLNSSNFPVDVESRPYGTGFTPTSSSTPFKYCGQTLDKDVSPINNYVLILKDQMQEFSQGGVYIGSKPNKEFVGRVLAVGPGKLIESTGAVVPVSVNVGDMVLFEPPEEESVLTYNNQKCVLITDDRVYATISLAGLSQQSAFVAERITPLHDRLFVRIIDTPTKTASGLVLAKSENRNENLMRAEIVAIGPGSFTDDGKLTPVKDLYVGDRILFSDSISDGGEFTCNQKQHAFVRYRSVLAKL